MILNRLAVADGQARESPCKGASGKIEPFGMAGVHFVKVRIAKASAASDAEQQRRGIWILNRRCVPIHLTLRAVVNAVRTKDFFHSTELASLSCVAAPTVAVELKAMGDSALNV